MNPNSGSDSSSSSGSSGSSWSSGKKSSSGSSGSGKTSSSGGKWNTDGGCGGSSSGSSSWSSGKKTSSSGKTSGSSGSKWSTNLGGSSGTTTNRPCSLNTTGARDDDNSDYSTTQISCDCNSVTSTDDEPQVTECTGGNYIVLDGGWEMYSAILDESLTLDGKYNQDDDDDDSFSFTREDGLAGIWIEQETNGNEYYLIVGEVTSSDTFELMYKTGVSLWTQDDNPLINSNDESEWEPFVDETLEFITSNMTFYNCRDEKVESEEFVDGWTNYFDNYNDADKWNLMFVLGVTVFNLFYFLA